MDLPEFNLTLECAPNSGPEFAACPTTRGVAVLEAEDGRPVMILSAARLRDALLRRLGPDDAPEAKTRSADLRPVVRRVRLAQVGSVFEGDLLFLRMAHEIMPATFRAVMDHKRGWFVHIDPDETFPKFTVIPTSAMPGSLPPGGELIGPVMDKHAAQRLTQTLEDLFDLCRFHHILVRAPDGDACAYKELGKCPAPCDGSESLDSYRARIGAAIRYTREPWPLLAERTRRMEDAAKAMDFETAQRHKHWLDAASALDNHRTHHALGDWRRGWAVIASSARPRVARAYVVGPAGHGACEPDADAIATAAAGIAGSRPVSALASAIVGMVCDALHRANRRNERIIALGAPGWADRVRGSVAHLSRGASHADDDPTDRDTEFTTEPLP